MFFDYYQYVLKPVITDRYQINDLITFFNKLVAHSLPKISKTFLWLLSPKKIFTESPPHKTKF